jgi:hypothetical protein
MMMISAPRPVSTPPTDVAIRVPCAVVVKSLTAFRSESRVENSSLYQAAFMMLRQSRASLSARSWP